MKYIQLTRSWCLGLLFNKHCPSQVSTESQLRRDLGKQAACTVRTAVLRRLAALRSLGEAELGQWCSKCGPETGSSIITWELVRICLESEILQVGLGWLFQQALR